MDNAQDSDELEVYESNENQDEEAFVTYDIATYPSDLTLSVVHEMWDKGDIEIPQFQRHFVWTIKQASLLIESFLMGLPVPQAFVYVGDENKSLVIDGQQRILSVIYFFEGYFGSENVQGRRQVFRLTGLNPRSPFHRKTFSELEEGDQRKLRGAILRFMNVRQLDPKKEYTSVYHIFERLNTGGTPLKPQEIRHCVFRGQLVNTLVELNKIPSWRDLIGKQHLDKHQKDVELILRTLALYKNWKNYEKPMKEYLNREMRRNRDAKTERVSEFVERFPKVVDTLSDTLGKKPFHVRGPLNSSVLDCIICTLLETGGSVPADIAERYQLLKSDEEFQETTYINTSDEKVLRERFRIAKKYLVD